MGVNNLWEVTLNMEQAGQRMACVFWYRGNAITTPEALDIAEQFEQQVLPHIEAMSFNDVFYDNISVRDIMSEDTAVELPVGTFGAGGAGDSLPPHNAYSFTLRVGTNVTRPGSKRIPGVGEPAQTDGTITNGSTITDLQTLGDAIATNLFDTATGLIAQAAPVIVKRILTGDGTYRLPTSVGELVTNAVIAAIPSLLVSSQVSRKIKSTI